jgi:uncharacterized protein (DUF58 family)
MEGKSSKHCYITAKIRILSCIPVKEILHKVKKLDIKIRRIVDSSFAGEYRSAFRGQGLEFDEVRAYQFGDDIRSIDWNVTARSDTVYVKLFREEREQELFVILDTSGSLDFGIEGQNKKEIATELAAIFAYSAMKNNDRFGLLLFSDQVEKFYRPVKGRSHILSMMSNMLEFQAAHAKTNLKQALEFFRSIQKKRSVVIVISDFMDAGYEESIRKLSRRHEVILIRLYHPSEILNHREGILPVRDNEAGIIRWLSAGGNLFARNSKTYLDSIQTNLEEISRQKHVFLLSIDTSKDYVPVLGKFFQQLHAAHSK